MSDFRVEKKQVREGVITRWEEFEGIRNRKFEIFFFSSASQPCLDIS